MREIHLIECAPARAGNSLRPHGCTRNDREHRVNDPSLEILARSVDLQVTSKLIHCRILFRRVDVAGHIVQLEIHQHPLGNVDVRVHHVRLSRTNSTVLRLDELMQSRTVDHARINANVSTARFECGLQRIDRRLCIVRVRHDWRARVDSRHRTRNTRTNNRIPGERHANCRPGVSRRDVVPTPAGRQSGCNA